MSKYSFVCFDPACVLTWHFTPIGVSGAIARQTARVNSQLLHFLKFAQKMDGALLGTRHLKGGGISAAKAVSA
jgi:hypothetical protein